MGGFCSVPCEEGVGCSVVPVGGAGGICGVPVEGPGAVSGVPYGGTAGDDLK